MIRFIICLISVSVFLMASEHVPYDDERYREVNDQTIALNKQSMGNFMTALKSYLTYTASQNVPGTKETGVGYYFDNDTKQMKRSLFYRLGRGYPRQTHRSLDIRVDGDGFFVIELPGGWPAFTHDGRFELDENNRLVTLAQGFPVLGENGYIYVPNEDFFVDTAGVITHNNHVIDAFRIEWPANKNNLNSFNQAIFYLSKEEYESPAGLAKSTYRIQQGFLEESAITKGFIGQVPEWTAGHEANVRMIKSYVRNMSSSVQVANPQ